MTRLIRHVRLGEKGGKWRGGVNFVLNYRSSSVIFFLFSVVNVDHVKGFLSNHNDSQNREKKEISRITL